MKVVVAHSAYRSSQPSGENAAVDAEVQLLRRSGAEVHVFIPSSDELVLRGRVGTALGALGAVWNLRARARLHELVESVRPDVVHVHNLFPRLSAAVLAPIRWRGAALVSTFHNYRLFCATGLALRQGQPCLECLDAGHPLPSLLHGCYRDRRVATAPVAAALALQRVTGVWRSLDAAISLTDLPASASAEIVFSRSVSGSEPVSALTVAPLEITSQCAGAITTTSNAALRSG